MSKTYVKYLDAVTKYTKKATKGTATDTDFIGIQKLIADMVTDYALNRCMDHAEYRVLIDAATMAKDAMKKAVME